MFHVKHSAERIVVVGGGHAGIEAAHACARLGIRAVLVTQRKDTIGVLSCNPAIGGIGKGHLVAEIDALDGVIGRAADASGIQFRLLNRRKGPAVHGPRVQCDRQIYRDTIQKILFSETLIEVVEDEVVDLLVRGGRVTGVKLETGQEIDANSVILTTGTFLGGRIFRGNDIQQGGRIGDNPANLLSERIRETGLPIGRLKTGTPPRLDSRSIRYDKLLAQPGDDVPVMLSSMSKEPEIAQVPCHITRTNSKTHKIIARNLHHSAVYSGIISGSGPRYCPSIEDKVARFPERDSHQIFLEPEGLACNLVYPNGISSSLPAETQDEYVHSIPGLENARIVHHGYAVEYDFVEPQSLMATLECRLLPGLFLAGQINGTTGYEEAAAQGLIAGLNAVAQLRGEAPIILDRADGYIGVLIDDLITQEIREPYRMFTSRAEFRLMLRADNADRRLTPLGIKLGCVREPRRIAFEDKMSKLQAITESLNNRFLSDAEIVASDISQANDGRKRNLVEMLSQAGINHDWAPDIKAELASHDRRLLEQIVNDTIYAPYAKRQKRDVAEMRRQQVLRLPEELDYGVISGLSAELREKLERMRPENLGQASRIDGMTPAALTLLLAHIRRRSGDRAA